MADLKFLQTNPMAEIRQSVLDMIQESKIFVRRGDINYIDQQLRTVDQVQSFIPVGDIEYGSPVSSSDMNRRMEGAHIDHVIAYARLKNLMAGMDEVTSLYQNMIGPAIDRILEYESKVRALRRAMTHRGVYNNIIHETFNVDNNYEGSDRKLAVNKVSGTLRLPATGRLLTNPETSNISYEVLTEGVTLVDESPIDNLYSRDTFKPWFVSLVARNVVLNRSYGNIDLTGYQGVAVLVRVQFPSVQQLNRISLSYFSTDVMDILGVFYSEFFDQSLDSINLKEVDVSFYADREDTAKEMNVYDTESGDTEIINAAEVLLVLGQRDYVQVDGTVEYDIPPNIDGFRTLLSEYEYNRRIQLNSMASMKDADVLFNVEDVMGKVNRIDLKDGDRNYIIGMSLFGIENVVYSPFGIFRSPKFTTSASYIAFSLDVNNRPFGIREAVELYFININEERIPIGTLDQYGRVKDSALLKAVDAANNIYELETNFIPAITDGKFSSGTELYLDGVQLPDDEYEFIRPTTGGYVLQVQTPIAHENSIMTMAYPPAELDHSNSVYDPTRIDLIKRIGKPNLDINFITYNINDYIFVKATDDSVVSYREGAETSMGMVGDRLFMVIHVDDAKGIVPKDRYVPTDDESDLFNPDYYYLQREKVVDIENDVYTLLKNQRFQYQGIPITKWSDMPSLDPVPDEIEISLEHNYAKNLIVIEVDGSHFKLTDDQQYDLDTDDTKYDKSVARIKTEWINEASDIRVHYVPLFATDLFLESNILDHNSSESFDSSVDSRVELLRTPYVDPVVPLSPKWILSRGVFHHVENFSVTYEPVVVYVGNRKAYNITEYYEGQEEESYAEDDVTYTVLDNIITFNRDVENVKVSYYFLGNSFYLDIEMFKGDNSKYFTTPELKDYTVLNAIWAMYSQK